TGPCQACENAEAALYQVTVETVSAQPFVAARRLVHIPEIMKVWKPALDEVWAFLREHPEHTPGHNVFLYHHPTQMNQPMEVDFGVAVGRRFACDGPVFSTETPAGEVATTLHVGSYMKMPEAHKAIHSWVAANGRTIGGASWEIYGDWNDDETKLETRIVY